MSKTISNQEFTQRVTEAWPTLTPSKRLEIYSLVMADKAHSLEPEVRDMVAGMAESTLWRWLHSVGAPHEAFILLGAIDLFIRNADAKVQIETMPEVLNAAVVLGGKFGINGESYTVERPAPGLGEAAQAEKGGTQ